METQTRTTTLYRFFNSAGELLYIGITSQGAERWNQHSKEKLWWADVRSTTVEHFPTREAALDAEKQAIKTEGPLHNVVHNRGGSDTHPPKKRTTPLVCHACGLPVVGDEGYIEVSYAMIRAFENGWSEQPARWREWHRACDPDPSGNVYWIGSERLTTTNDILRFDDHLCEKSWMKNTDWDDACLRLLER